MGSQNWRKELDLAMLENGDRFLLSWRKGMGSQSWRKELDLAILEKGYGALQFWRKEIGPCNLGERRWALQSGREMTRSWSPVES